MHKENENIFNYHLKNVVRAVQLKGHVQVRLLNHVFLSAIAHQNFKCSNFDYFTIHKTEKEEKVKRKNNISSTLTQRLFFFSCMMYSKFEHIRLYYQNNQTTARPSVCPKQFACHTSEMFILAFVRYPSFFYQLVRNVFEPFKKPDNMERFSLVGLMMAFY